MSRLGRLRGAVPQPLAPELRTRRVTAVEVAEEGALSGNARLSQAEEGAGWSDAASGEAEEGARSRNGPPGKAEERARSSDSASGKAEEGARSSDAGHPKSGGGDAFEPRWPPGRRRKPCVPALPRPGRRRRPRVPALLRPGRRRSPRAPRGGGGQWRSWGCPRLFRLMIWLGLKFAVSFGYGKKHSVMRPRPRRRRPQRVRDTERARCCRPWWSNRSSSSDPAKTWPENWAHRRRRSRPDTCPAIGTSTTDPGSTVTRQNPR